MVLKVRYLVDGIEPLTEIEQGDWIDLRCAEDVMMDPMEYRLLRLGVAMELPKGYEAIIAPRSSTFKRFGILMVNSLGIIDESYCGDTDEWRFPALAIHHTVIRKGDRICQFRLIRHQDPVSIECVDSLGNLPRGGIGSTGVR